ncbi:hypothetical protein RB614_43530 [Phytohabitans sp. ZYX-F-186]|uniref:Secreted protein n=1 Tax=Phytohabitans maris TaxID=3071409 RepID=A0ABU0ZWS4_9ACTN|nr:hypothetical protein [Phytohabitans sp. ZYX-F-186]MDQ7911380.1 hypothetical protein [Phytohabitans sp. ZYX-F-186]
MLLLGIALIVSGAMVLYVLRRVLWPRLAGEKPETPPAERVHYVGPPDDLDPVDIPIDVTGYGARPIYVPPDRGTVYMSRAARRPNLADRRLDSGSHRQTL